MDLEKIAPAPNLPLPQNQDHMDNYKKYPSSQSQVPFPIKENDKGSNFPSNHTGITIGNQLVHERDKDDTTIICDDELFRRMVEHIKRGVLYVYVEHKVDISQYADYESNDDIDKECESRVGPGGSGGPCNSGVGEASNVDGSQVLNRDVN
ncbi:hypothetical protein V6N13_059788 [Hibiscus sabdariffa]